MTRTFLTIGLAAASLPMMFAKSQAPAAVPGAASKPAVVSHKNHHHRKATGKAVSKTGAKTSASAKPTK